MYILVSSIFFHWKHSLVCAVLMSSFFSCSGRDVGAWPPAVASRVPASRQLSATRPPAAAPLAPAARTPTGTLHDSAAGCPGHGVTEERTVCGRK